MKKEELLFLWDIINDMNSCLRWGSTFVFKLKLKWRVIFWSVLIKVKLQQCFAKHMNKVHVSGDKYDFISLCMTNNVALPLMWSLDFIVSIVICFNYWSSHCSLSLTKLVCVRASNPTPTHWHWTKMHSPTSDEQRERESVWAEKEMLLFLFRIAKQLLHLVSIILHNKSK